MTDRTEPIPSSAYVALPSGNYQSTILTRGPWDPQHQHAGPPIALVCRAIERAAAEYELGHIARLTANLLRPIPIGELVIELATDYVGRNAGHLSARLLAAGKELARFTALALRESNVAIPEGLPGHPLPAAPPGPDNLPSSASPLAPRYVGYGDLMEARAARGKSFSGPCAVWFRLRYPLVDGEQPSAYQRVPVAADSGNGISAILDFTRYSFVNSDLTINLLRRPQGEWICLDARTQIGPDGCALAESALYDTQGLIGRATQSLLIRPRG